MKVEVSMDLEYTAALRAAMVGRRLYLGLSQGELAARLIATGEWPDGLRGSGVSKLETGKAAHAIDDRRLVSWASALGWRPLTAVLAAQAIDRVDECGK